MPRCNLKLHLQHANPRPVKAGERCPGSSRIALYPRSGVSPVFQSSWTLAFPVSWLWHLDWSGGYKSVPHCLSASKIRHILTVPRRLSGSYCHELTVRTVPSFVSIHVLGTLLASACVPPLFRPISAAPQTLTFPPFSASETHYVTCTSEWCAKEGNEMQVGGRVNNNRGKNTAPGTDRFHLLNRPIRVPSLYSTVFSGEAAVGATEPHRAISAISAQPPLLLLCTYDA